MVHEHEIAFVGYSGAGKTTLVSRLIARMRDRYRVGYVKHDAHRFVMDTPGKDTWTARQAGAHAVFINDPRHAAWIGPPEVESDASKPSAAAGSSAPPDLFASCDLVLVEGRKHSRLPKFVLVDPRDEARELFASGALENVLGVIGAGGGVGEGGGVGARGRPDYVDPELPYYDRNDLDAIEAAMEEYLAGQAARVPVKGLILAGGRSRRMGTDKAFIEYHGRPQVDWLYDEAKAVLDDVVVSCRTDQLDDPRLAAYTLVPDRFVDFGPAGAILTALHRDRGAAWLVLACDMPFADRTSIAYLLSERSPTSIATAYASPSDGLAEPLFAIWEPESAKALHAALARDTFCPRRVLGASRARLIRTPDARAVENINLPEERARTRELIGVSSGRPTAPATRGARRGEASS